VEQVPARRARPLRRLPQAGATVGLSRTTSVDIGQFRIPFTTAGDDPNGGLPALERPMFASDVSRGAFAGLRDMGAVLRTRLPLAASLSVGAFNGVGDLQNATDRNDQKLVAGSLVVPLSLAKGLSLGVSGAYGGHPSASQPRRERVGLLAQYLRGALTSRAEYVSGADGGVRRRGYYGLLMERVTPKVELVQRYDFWDPDTRLATSLADEGTREGLLGLNYYILGNNAKLQLNVAQRSWTNSRAAASQIFMLNMQTAW
jgi:hypothetical protein